MEEESRGRRDPDGNAEAHSQAEWTPGSKVVRRGIGERRGEVLRHVLPFSRIKLKIKQGWNRSQARVEFQI